MKKRIKTLIAIFAVVALLAPLCACNRSKLISDTQAETLREFGDVLVSDLQKEILPRREKLENLVANGYVLYTEEKTYGADLLAEFSAMYGREEDCEVTIVFSDKSFVVARVIFFDGAGYYLRYEYDTFHPDSLAVSGQLIDTANLNYQKKPEKWELTLLKDKKEQVVFTLRNPQPPAE